MNTPSNEQLEFEAKYNEFNDAFICADKTAKKSMFCFMSAQSVEEMALFSVEYKKAVADCEELIDMMIEKFIGTEPVKFILKNNNQ